MSRRLTGRGWSQATLLALLASVFATSVGAQGSHVLRGTVRDSAGEPIPEADVAIVAQRLVTRSNAKGEYVLPRVRPGAAIVSVRRIGFEPRSIRIDILDDPTTPLDLVLAAHALLLEGMEVSARERRRLVAIEDFYRRRAKGSGMFVTREDIEQRHALKLSDALRDLPGLRFERGRGGTLLRFLNSASQRRDCVPQYWIDGVRVANLELDEIPVHDVEGVELYDGPSTTPIQFAHFGGQTSCGTVVIWSRVPGT